jgi:hypothetical protein
MHFDDANDNAYPQIKDRSDDKAWNLNGPGGPLEPSEDDDAPYEPGVSLAVQPPEKKYSVESSLQFSHYLNKEASSRYQAIVLNAWTGSYDSPHFEVGLVQIKNRRPPQRRRTRPSRQPVPCKIRCAR